jgi:hypothetical protein
MSFRPRPGRPRSHGPAHRREPECPRGRSCRRAGRSGTPAPPSPCNTASSEGSGSSRVLPGSSPITSPRQRRKHTRSQGPSLHRRYPASSVLWPCPTPARTGARGAVEAATLVQRGAPPLPDSPFRRAMPTTPADRTGAHVDCFPIRAAFPETQAGRHPRHHFRGLLRLHSRYGPSDRSTAQSGLCHEASARPVTRPNRSSATRPIDNYLGGSFLHW